MAELPARLIGPDPDRGPAGRSVVAVGSSIQATVDEDLLACGVGVSTLVDQVDAGRLEPADPHQASCPSCQAALRDAVVSGRALDLLRAARGPVPVGLIDRVMHTVRQSRGASTVLDLPESATLPVAGGIRVHLHVLGAIARAAAAGEPGVTVAGCSATTEAEELGGGLRVALGLLVDGRTPLPALASSLRRAVRRALRHATGLQHVQVELAALDLIAPTDTKVIRDAPQLFGPDGV